MTQPIRIGAVNYLNTKPLIYDLNNLTGGAAALFVAIGGSNSFIYAFDLAVPLILYLTAAHWGQVPLVAKKTAVWLMVGVGLVPLLVCVTLADRLNVMYASISFCRLAGAMGLMCVISAVAGELKEGGAGLLVGFSWANVVLVLATFLQSRGWIESNVFYNAASESASAVENESMRFIVAGLFRGSLGIIGTLGWVAFLAQYHLRGPRALLALAGGAAGALLIVLCGSKTSLLAVLVVTVAGIVLFPQILRHLWGRLAALSLGLVAVSGMYLLNLDTDYFSYTFGLFGLSEDSMDTFNYRQERWREALDFAVHDPAVMMGMSTPFGQEDRGLGYFHNEYITLLMGGGVWSEGAYLMGLLLIGWTAFRGRTGADTGQVFAGLTLLGGLVQGASVNHLVPGIFFVSTTTITACAYGLGFGREARRGTSLAQTACEDELHEPELAPSHSLDTAPSSIP